MFYKKSLWQRIHTKWSRTNIQFALNKYIKSCIYSKKKSTRWHSSTNHIFSHPQINTHPSPHKRPQLARLNTSSSHHHRTQSLYTRTSTSDWKAFSPNGEPSLLVSANISIYLCSICWVGLYIYIYLCIHVTDIRLSFMSRVVVRII